MFCPVYAAAGEDATFSTVFARGGIAIAKADVALRGDEAGGGLRLELLDCLKRAAGGG